MTRRSRAAHAVFGRFQRVLGHAGQNIAAFGSPQRIFGTAWPELAPTPRFATIEFFAQNLDLQGLDPRSSMAKVEYTPK